MSRLKERFDKEIIAELQEELGIPNRMAVPRLEKVVVNIGVGEAIQNIKLLDAAKQELSLITGQWPAVGRARKSIAQFKLRKGLPIACYTTLRGKRMYEFMDRLINLAIPRVRDFRGLNQNSFDGRGNYSMGVSEQSVFPEINIGKVEFQQGMNITFVTTAKTDEEARKMLRLFGMPFKSDADKDKI